MSLPTRGDDKVDPSAFWQRSYCLGIQFLQLGPKITEIILRLGQIIFTVGGVWAATKVVDAISDYFTQLALQSPNKFDDILAYT